MVFCSCCDVLLFLEHFAYPLTPYITLYLCWGIFQIIQCSCRAVQCGYFQETLGCRKEFDLAQLKKKQLSIMTFTRLHTCPWKELMECLSSSFCFPPHHLSTFGLFHKKVMDCPVTSLLFSSSSLSLSGVIECGRVV